MAEHTYPIGYAWACMHPVIRQVNKDMAEAAASMTPYVLGILIDAQFEVGFGDEFPLQESLWKEGYNIQEDSIEIGEAEFIIYRANRAWMTQLYTELLLGQVSLSDPFPCKRYNFAPGIVPIEYP